MGREWGREARAVSARIGSNQHFQLPQPLSRRLRASAPLLRDAQRISSSGISFLRDAVGSTEGGPIKKQSGPTFRSARLLSVSFGSVGLRS